MATPFVNYTPNYSGVALLYADLIDLIANDPANISLRDLYLRIALGTVQSAAYYDPRVERLTRYSLYHTRPPVAMLHAHSADTVLIILTGVMGNTAAQDLVHEYVNGYTEPPYADPQNNPANRPNLSSWGFDYFDEVGRIHPLTGKNFRIIGHSLGGAIATRMALLAIQMPSVGTVHLCTFGSPKAWERNYDMPNSITYVRWVNPEDNVPRLPPAPAQAPEIWALLTRSQQTRVLSWRHPCQGAEVTASGSMSLVGDQPSANLSLNTILQAMNSPLGVTGPGHGIVTYQRYLSAAQGSTIPLQPTTPIAPQIAEPVGPAPAANLRIPAVLPSLPTPAETTARRTAFAASSHAHNVPDPQIPKPARMVIVRHISFWTIEWMGYLVAYAPTKKKARACCNHYNKFLHVFLGVHSADRGAFIGALTDWLASASDSANGFIPTLNTGIFE